MRRGICWCAGHKASYASARKGLGFAQHHDATLSSNVAFHQILFGHMLLVTHSLGARASVRLFPSAAIAAWGNQGSNIFCLPSSQGSIWHVQKPKNNDQAREAAQCPPHIAIIG
jgi:hypothetical protein